MAACEGEGSHIEAVTRKALRRGMAQLPMRHENYGRLVHGPWSLVQLLMEASSSVTALSGDVTDHGRPHGSVTWMSFRVPSCQFLGLLMCLILIPALALCLRLFLQ